MKFKKYMMNEAFDKFGKQLTQIHKKIQKTQSCEGLQMVVVDAIKTLNGIKGIGAGIELFFRNYTEVIRKMAIDLSLNTIGTLQYIEMSIDPLDGNASKNNKNREELRKIQKSIRDNDYKLKLYLAKDRYSDYKVEKLIDFFGQMNDDIKKVIKIKSKVMK